MENRNPSEKTRCTFCNRGATHVIGENSNPPGSIVNPTPVCDIDLQDQRKKHPGHAVIPVEFYELAMERDEIDTE